MKQIMFMLILAVSGTVWADAVPLDINDGAPQTIIVCSMGECRPVVIYDGVR